MANLTKKDEYGQICVNCKNCGMRGKCTCEEDYNTVLKNKLYEYENACYDEKQNEIVSIDTIKFLKKHKIDWKEIIRMKEKIEEEELEDRLQKSIELPCKVGDKIYVINCFNYNYDYNYLEYINLDDNYFEISDIIIYEEEIYINYIALNKYTNFALVNKDVSIKKLNKTWFLTREEAENKLKELESECTTN